MNKYDAILAREFRARFPDAKKIKVRNFADDEAIEVTVDGRVYRCEAGSDDDCFNFVDKARVAPDEDLYLVGLSGDDRVLRIDFPADWLD